MTLQKQVSKEEMFNFNLFNTTKTGQRSYLKDRNSLSDISETVSPLLIMESLKGVKCAISL